jgi:hypothetical protein
MVSRGRRRDSAMHRTVYVLRLARRRPPAVSLPGMVKRSSPPATKKDLLDLEARMDRRLDRTMQDLKSRLIAHFNVVAENLVHDFKGIFVDRLAQHEDRIVRLERRTGIRP